MVDRFVNATNQNLAILKSMVTLRLGDDNVKNPGNSDVSYGQITRRVKNATIPIRKFQLKRFENQPLSQMAVEPYSYSVSRA